MPTIENSNSTTKDEIRALLDSMRADGATALHRLKWTPQDAASVDRGPMVFCAQEGTFDVSVTVTGSTTSGSAVVTGLPRTINLHVGMNVSGTGIPASTTVLSIDSATQVTLSANATATGTPSLTFSGTFAGGNPSIDPVINFGYNAAPGGNEIVNGEGLAIFQIEGHYVRDSDDVALMEAFVAFNIAGTSGQARPIFTWFDKNNKVPLSVDMSPGTASAFNIYFQDYAGGAGGSTYVFKRNEAQYNAVGTAGNKLYFYESFSGYSNYLDFSAHGDSCQSGRYSARFAFSALGGSSQHRTFSINMRSNNNASAKTGAAAFRADDTAGYDSVMLQIGAGGSLNTALVTFTSVNMPVNVPTLELISKASQTARTFKVDGINNDSGVIEASKFSIYPKGYVAVRESGNTTTDRTPTTGSSTITPAWTNKPGASTSGTATWFPVLSTTGALFWVPGFAD